MRKQPKTAFIAAIELLSKGESDEMVQVSDSLGLDLVWDLEDTPDVILYAGGVDINPALYGEKPLPTTQQPNLLRDGMEILQYQIGREWGAVNLGVCRGAQLLNVLNGGKLWQHVDGHNKDHGVRVKGPDKYQHYVHLAGELTSSHHQMIIPPRNGNERHNPFEIVAEAMAVYNNAEERAHQRWMRNTSDKRIPDRKEIEGIWYPNTQSLGVQFHPGWNTHSAKVLKDLFNWWVRKETISCVA